MAACGTGENRVRPLAYTGTDAEHELRKKKEYPGKSYIRTLNELEPRPFLNMPRQISHCRENCSKNSWLRINLDQLCCKWPSILHTQRIEYLDYKK